MASGTCKKVIDSDKTPEGEHVETFNGSTIGEVALVIDDDKYQLRSILFHRRNE